MSEAPHEHQPLLSMEDVESTPVYPIIHMIRQDMEHFIDTPLTYEALMAPDLTYTLIKPLEEKYANIQRKGNSSIVFCFLLNRVHFLHDKNLVTSALSRSRAALCEILATRALRGYGDNTLNLALVITTVWPVYSGADEGLMQQSLEELNLDVEDLEHYVGNAIEMAILGSAKRFIKSPACQKVIDSIYSGKCVYQAQSNHAILSDTYKRTPIHFYDPHKAPLLDHYRLKVPAVRSVLEYFNFLIMFVLFVMTLELNERDRINWAEGIFMVYALGFSLEKIAAIQEHGLKVYFTGTWNGFDLAFITIYGAYASLRFYGIKNDIMWARASGINCLAVAACLIFPRLAFVTLKNNLMVLSLRAMIVQFAVLMFIAVFCFGGFLYALWTLAKNGPNYDASDIAWWMADLWFGLDATGFQLASTFHHAWGPILMVTYTCLSNTLLLTVLVSILSHTFSTISEDAAAEAMFRRAVLTLEGVKADSLFSYQPPINLAALTIMLPARFILTPRWFHKVNVFMIRATSFPILLMITIYERHSKSIETTTFSETVSVTVERVMDTLPRGLKRLSFFEGFLAGNSADIDVIFELEEEIMNNSNSALDTREHDHSNSKALVGLQHRRASQSTYRRSSRGEHQSGHESRDASPTRGRLINKDNLQFPITQNRTDASPQSQTQPMQAPGVRGRMNSILQRGAAEMGIGGSSGAANYTSPLAQIYQPLIVDDDIVEGNGVSSSPTPMGSNTPNAPQYVPITRRRLSSMHRFPAIDPQNSPSSTTLRRFASTGARIGGGQVMDMISMAVPESPPAEEQEMENATDTQTSTRADTEQHSMRSVQVEEPSPSEPEPTAEPAPETAGEVIATERSEGLMPQVNERLETMEERQKRIEDLLLQLMTELRGIRSTIT